MLGNTEKNTLSTVVFLLLAGSPPENLSVLLLLLLRGLVIIFSPILNVRHTRAMLNWATFNMIALLSRLSWVFVPVVLLARASLYAITNNETFTLKTHFCGFNAWMQNSVHIENILGNVRHFQVRARFSSNAENIF